MRGKGRPGAQDHLVQGRGGGGHSSKGPQIDKGEKSNLVTVYKLFKISNLFSGPPPNGVSVLPPRRALLPPRGDGLRRVLVPRLKQPGGGQEQERDAARRG